MYIYTNNYIYAHAVCIILYSICLMSSGWHNYVLADKGRGTVIYQQFALHTNEISSWAIPRVPLSYDLCRNRQGASTQLVALVHSPVWRAILIVTNFVAITLLCSYLVTHLEALVTTNTRDDE